VLSAFWLVYTIILPYNFAGTIILNTFASIAEALAKEISNRPGFGRGGKEYKRAL
jgi:hypothetical protein